MEREFSGENTPPRPSVKRSKILIASDIMNKQFETLQFSNGWEQLFQEPARRLILDFQFNISIKQIKIKTKSK